ncbi:transposase [Limosilactobacillus reuteri]|uniref:transposase n=1 Tax=Limosilactobacillus reuteri TaxID=1598 RepID=UPI001E5392C5|nr:transposase [Limosilactobacillus reuteri]MCC4421734.1 transposase [Limosilactobacillus reuteri]
MRGNILNAELFDAFPNLDDQVSVLAFEQQKVKLKSSYFGHIFHQFNQQIPSQQLLDQHYYILAIDGSDFNLPWNLQSNYACDFSKNKPYCQMHINVLYGLLNSNYQDCVIQPKAKMNERESALDIFGLMPNNSIVLID